MIAWTAAQILFHWARGHGVATLAPDRVVLDNSERAALERVLGRLESLKKGDGRKLLLDGQLHKTPLELRRGLLSAGLSAGVVLENLAQEAKVLSKILQAGARGGLWAGDQVMTRRLPVLPHGIPADAPLAERRILEVRDGLWRDLKAGKELRDADAAGRLLLVAVLHEWIITPYDLAAVARAGMAGLQATGALRYSAWYVPDQSRGRASVRRKQHRRLFPTLLLRDGNALKNACNQLKGLTGRKAEDCMWRLIQGYMQTANVSQHSAYRTIADLMADMRAYLSLRLPPYAVQYLAGEFHSTEPPEPFLRCAMGFGARKRQITPSSEIPLANEAATVVIDPFDEPDDVVTLLKEATGNSDPSVMQRSLSSLQATGVAAGKHALALLAEWGVQQLGSRELGPLARRPAIVRRALVTLAPSLIRCIGNNDALGLAMTHIEALGGDALRDILDQPNRSRLMADLLRLQKFLCSKSGLRLQDADIRALVVPDAGIFSPALVNELCDELVGPISPVPAGLARDVATALVAGETLGLRTSELHLIYLRHAVLDYLRIVETDSRGLKTSSAPRNTPFELLLDRLKQPLEALIGTRLQAEGQQPGSAFLFAAPDGGALSPQRVHVPVSRLMREIAGISALRMYHFRHSLASWLALGIAYHVHGLEALRGRLGDLEEVLDHGREWASIVLRNGNVMNFLFEIAILLGHSRPTISSEHYIHVFDLILLGLAEKYGFEESGELLLAAARLSRTTAWRHAEDGPEEILRLVERIYPEGIAREDIPRRRGRRTRIGEAAYIQLCTLRAALASGVAFGCSEEDLQSASDRATRLACETTSKVGSTVGRHDVAFEPGARCPLPRALLDDFARTGAKRAARGIARAQEWNPEEAAWALEHYARHAQRSRGRVSSSSLTDARRFGRVLIAGGLKPRNLQWGRGLAACKGDLFADSVSGESFWVCIAPKRPNRSLIGANWAWQMAYIQGPHSPRRIVA